MKRTLDQLLATIDVDPHAFSVCRIQTGWRMTFPAVVRQQQDRRGGELLGNRADRKASTNLGRLTVTLHPVCMNVDDLSSPDHGDGGRGNAGNGERTVVEFIRSG